MIVYYSYLIIYFNKYTIILYYIIIYKNNTIFTKMNLQFNHYFPPGQVSISCVRYPRSSNKEDPS